MLKSNPLLVGLFSVGGAFVIGITILVNLVGAIVTGPLVLDCMGLVDGLSVVVVIVVPLGVLLLSEFESDAGSCGGQREGRKSDTTFPQFLAHSNRPGFWYVTLSVPHTGLYSDVTRQELMQACIAAGD